jgi:hypothetical protein
MNRRIAFAVLTAAALSACTEEQRITGPFALSADEHKFSCPSSGTPLPGSRVSGELEVNGTCVLDGVTINGDITIVAGGSLQAQNITVIGGISVLKCGELDVNLGAPTGTTSTINGDIVINASDQCTSPAFSDVDIWTTHIKGNISVTGAYLSRPTICGNNIGGNVTLDRVTTSHHFWIGDPDGFGGCPGNTIEGTLSLSNSSADFEVESNTVGGSVLLSGTTLELNGNTIRGSLRCSSGAVILPGEAPDPSGNTVRGANRC